MDETPEELERIRQEADGIDPYRYRRRYRWTLGVIVLLLCTGATWAAVHMAKASRNPCETVRDYFCRVARDEAKCSSYQQILDESVHDQSPRMRGVIRDQCLTKIRRMKEEDGISLD